MTFSKFVVFFRDVLGELTWNKKMHSISIYHYPIVPVIIEYKAAGTTTS